MLFSLVFVVVFCADSLLGGELCREMIGGTA